jgi:hypothetical protein
MKSGGYACLEAIDKDNHPDGRGVSINAQKGTIFIGHWKNGYKHGEGLMILNNGEKVAGTWIKGRKKHEF